MPWVWCIFSTVPTVQANSAVQANYSYSDGVRNAAAVVYQYYPNSTYNVDTEAKRITDIQLQPGETITYVGGGDTVNWLLDTATVAGVSHVYIKPITDNISTNVIINTDRHSYRLNVFSRHDPDDMYFSMYHLLMGYGNNHFNASFPINFLCASNASITVFTAFKSSSDKDSIRFFNKSTFNSSSDV